MTAASMLHGQKFSWKDGAFIRHGIVQATWNNGRTGFVFGPLGEMIVVHADPKGEIQRADSHKVDLAVAEDLALKILAGKTPQGSVTEQASHLAAALVMVLAERSVAA